MPVSFTYPTTQTAFPSISAANPANRTYDSSVEPVDPVKLPVFTATGTGTLTIEFIVTSGSGTFATSETGTYSPSITITGDAATANSQLANIWFKPAPGSTGSIRYQAFISDSTGKETSFCDPLFVNDAVVSRQGQSASSIVTLTGNSGTITLKVNGVAINGGTSFQTDINTTTQELAASINRFQSIPDYNAEYLGGNQLQIMAPFGVGGTANGWNVTADVTGTLSITGQPFGGGVTQSTPEGSGGLLSGALKTLAKAGVYAAGALLANKVLNNTGATEITIESAETPEVAVVYDGLMFKVPDVYDVTRASTNQFWDYASFIETEQWTTNPALFLLHFVDNNRYGCGKDIRMTPEQRSRWYQDCWEAALYCDEMLPDGKGGTIPRFELNAVIQGMTKREVIEAVCSNMNARFLETTNGIRLVQDRPSSVKRLVTNVNAGRDGFTMSGGGLSSLYNYVEVKWNNPDNYYYLETTFAEDPTSILTQGERKGQFVAFGCTSEAQAKRKAKWMIENEKTDPRMVTYVAGLDHHDLIPGDVVALVDNSLIRTTDPVVIAQGGAIKLPSSNVMWIDRPLVMNESLQATIGGFGYLWVTLPDGSVESRKITNYETGSDRVSLEAAFTSEPNKNAVWVHTAYSTSLNSRLYRILSISEKEDGFYNVTAVKYDPTKYSRVDAL